MKLCNHSPLAKKKEGLPGLRAVAKATSMAIAIIFNRQVALFLFFSKGGKRVHIHYSTQDGLCANSTCICSLKVSSKVAVDNGSPFSFFAVKFPSFTSRHMIPLAR